MDPSSEEPPEGEPSFVPPIHPDDRLWRHPSEIGRYAAGASGRHNVRILRRFGPPTVAGALSGVLVAAIVLFTMHALLGSRPTASNTAARTPTPVGIDATLLHHAAARVANSLVTVSAQGPGWNRVGSGTVVSPDGLVMTAASLTEGASTLTVEVGTKTWKATLRGIDPDVGLALLSIAAKGLSPAPLAPPGELKPGQWVVAVGTVATRSQASAPPIAVGPIEAIHQPLQMTSGDLLDTVQFDIPLSRAALGGMLVNMQGQVVAVALKGASGPGSPGAAAPARLVMADTRQLAGTGKVSHGWLGVSGKGVPGGGTGETDRAGVAISSVVPNSPAAIAGLHSGDVVVAVNGQPTPDMAKLRQAIRLQSPGARVALSVMRSERAITLSAVLASTSS